MLRPTIVWSALMAGATTPVAQTAATYCRPANEKSQNNDFAGPIAGHTKAIELVPESALAYNNRANARKAKGDLHDAMDDADMALAIEARLQAPRRQQSP